MNNPARAGTPLCLSNIVFTARIKHYASPITNYPFPLLPSAPYIVTSLLPDNLKKIKSDKTVVSVRMEASAAAVP